MGAIAGDFNYREVELLANGSVVGKSISPIIDRKENDPVRHKGKIFLAYTTANNGWDIDRGYLCAGYDGWEDVECHPDYGWSYMGVKTFFKKVVPISTVFNGGEIRMYFDKIKHNAVFENKEDEEAFKELFRKMASEELE